MRGRRGGRFITHKDEDLQGGREGMRREKLVKGIENRWDIYIYNIDKIG